MPREFMLKQIENEINAGFKFVDAAKRVLKVDFSAVTRNELLNAANRADSAVGQVQSVTRQLIELRDAVDLMRRMHFEAQEAAGNEGNRFLTAGTRLE